MKQLMPSAALICLLVAMPALAEVYKWVDENGGVHYGDQRPQDKKDKEVETLNIRSGTAKSSTETVAGGSPQEKMSELEAAQAKAAEKAKDLNEKTKQAEARKVACENARKNLETMNTYDRIKVSENGQERYLAPEEIATRKANSEKSVKENCE